MVALSGPWRSVLHGIMAFRMKFRVDAEALMIQMATTATMILCAFFFLSFCFVYRCFFVVASVPFLCTTEHIQYPTIGITYKFIEPAALNAKAHIK